MFHPYTKRIGNNLFLKAFAESEEDLNIELTLDCVGADNLGTTFAIFVGGASSSTSTISSETSLTFAELLKLALLQRK